jgi:hypothetical protein
VTPGVSAWADIERPSESAKRAPPVFHPNIAFSPRFWKQ